VTTRQRSAHPGWAAACALCAACSCPGGGVGLDGGVDAGSDAGRADAGPDAGHPLGDAGGCETPLSGAGTPLLGTLNSPRRLALTGPILFIAEAGTILQSDGRVLAVPLDGGTAAPVATGLDYPDAIAADPDGVFVVDRQGLWRLGGDGGRASIDGTINNALFGDTDLALSATRVVYATGLPYLISADRQGAGSTTLFNGPAGSVVSSAALEGTTVFFLVADGTEPGLFAVPLDGSADAGLVSTAPVDGRSLLVTPTAFVWTQGGGGDGGLVWLPRDGGAPLSLAEGLQGPAHPVLLGGVAYFKDSTGGAPATSAFLQGVSLCRLGSAAPLGPQGIGPGDLQTDGVSLYFTSAQAGPGGFAARLP
jgi:hypothetical protein